MRKLSLLLLAVPLFLTSSFTNKTETTPMNAEKTGKYTLVTKVSSPYFYLSKIFRPNMLMVKRGDVANAPRLQFDEPYDLTITSDQLQDGGDACPYYHYHCWTNYPSLPHTWYTFNCYILAQYSASHVVVMMDSGLATNGWAAVAVEVPDSNGDPVYYELSVSRSYICDDPDPL
ncbi:hypothetical protein ACWKWU_15000 [Chitinophaga lutea]